MSTPEPSAHAAPAPEARRRWHRNLAWIAALLAVWFGVTFVVSWYARELTFAFFDWPFSFWVGAQGAPLVYLIVIVLYAWRMNRAPSDANPPGIADDETPPPPG